MAVVCLQPAAITPTALWGCTVIRVPVVSCQLPVASCVAHSGAQVAAIIKLHKQLLPVCQLKGFHYKSAMLLMKNARHQP